jgi:hypothetical protein
MQNCLFGRPGQMFLIVWCQTKWWACFWLCSSPISPFYSQWIWTLCVLLMLSSPNSCLNINQGLCCTFSEICTQFDAHSLFFWGSIANLHQGRYTTPNKKT